VTTWCDHPLTRTGKTLPDTPAPAAAASSQAAPENTLRLRAERARNDALALFARSQCLAQIQSEVSRQDLLTDSPFARLYARLATMPVIEQAKGILIFQQGCGPDEAFSLLRRASQRSNVPLRVLAEHIVSNAQRQSGQRHEDIPGSATRHNRSLPASRRPGP
jgi:hypothetical protein